MAADKLGQQVELMNQLGKSLSNFKKTPKPRLSGTYIEVKLKLLEEHWQNFTNNHMILINKEDIESEDYTKKDYYDKAEDLYTLAKCEMIDALAKLKALGPQSNSTLVPTISQPPVHSEIKLPRISLPSFSGKYSEWVSFHDMFASLIHQNTLLKNVQKLHYLKSSLSGEAEALLRHIPITDANYENAWSTLKKRFENKRFIVNSTLKKLLSQRNISTESSQAVKILLDTTNECLSALKNTGIDTFNWDPILVYISVAKLDPESIRLWEQYLSNNEVIGDELPTYRQLCSYLESRFRTLEVLESSKSNTKSNVRHSSFHTSFNTTCKFCNGNHYISNCKEFARLTFVNRKSFVEKNGLCYNCLIPNHTVLKCKQKTSCRRCGRKHHSLIHPENKSTDNVPAGGSGISHVRDNSQFEVTFTPVNNNVAAHYADKELTTNVLLATAIVKVRSQNGTVHNLRALIDQGSQGSFITESAAQFLGLKKIPINCKINGLGDEGRSLKSKNMVLFTVYSRYSSTFEMPVKAYILKSLTRILPTKEVCDENWSHLHRLELADPNFNQPKKVDLLLGTDVYSEIIREGLKKGPQGTPIAQNTYLGWILSGQLYNIQTTQSYTITINMHAYIEDNKLLQRFWEMESDVFCKKIFTEEEKKCEQHFKETYTRNKDGRYEVSLPFKEKDPSCHYGSSREIANRRLLLLERRLLKEPHLKNEYSKIMREYIELNHMEEIIDQEDIIKTNAVYLPHHAVIRPDKSTTKVRIVFDASCKYKNQVSLNDNLMIGPRLQPDLRHIIMRWRLHKVCLVADIIKMYRQIKVRDSDFQRILWRENQKEVTKDFRITRVTFGTSSAPYLATKVLQQLAHDNLDEFPQAANIILKDYYMDDLLTGVDSYEGGIIIYKQMTRILESGGFQLQKWNSNDAELLKYMHINENEIVDKELNLDMTIKTLGIAWNNKKDQFQYSINLDKREGPFTKRIIASDVSKLFDPMGWLAPTIIIGKIFLQRLWLSGVTWDQEISQELKEDWLKFRLDLPHLSEITLDRWLHTTSTGTTLELYGFADASSVAYAAVVYSRVIDVNGTIHIQLVSAKTKVAPVKTVSIPRLELCAAVLLARLLNEISEQLNVKKEDIYAYTDSKVVLYWLQGHPSQWKTFIANRTSEIITIFPSQHWNHVGSKENPADLASRGVLASVLKDEVLWWMGPKWLGEIKIDHKAPINLPNEFPCEERRIVAYNTRLEVNFSDNFKRYSAIEKLVRIIATCKRFRNIKKQVYPNYLTAEELEKALFVCIHICQKEEFEEDIFCLRERTTLKKSSKLLTLNPFLDKKDILRVGGRLRNADIPEDAKHQIILPANNPLSKLVIVQAHKNTLHGGPTLMLSYIRQKYWILGGRSMIRKEVHGCITCVRHKANTRTQLMADLPEPRVTPSRPFSHSGVDFAGPIDLRMSKGRGSKTYKGYICIFICMATRAVHIEIVSSLESESFVAAFKRFTARRGHCSHIWSDNATNFIAGNKLLKDMLKSQMSKVTTDILDQLAREGTTWHYIPAAAPHFGGLWEAGVRSIKYHLKRILGNSTLTYEEMSTAIVQIEACLNSRPISPISDNIEDLLPLTPGHFLIGEPLIIVPESSYLNIDVNRLNRWQLVQRMVQHFWNRWTKEYLTRLQQRPKWIKKINNDIKIGMLVLLKDNNLPPGKWALARIVNVHPGTDGLIRVVSVKCKNAILKRPITKICPLPPNI